jgi:hypothetical protein
MKITKTQLKQIIKEELERVLSENTTDLRAAEQTWKSYEGALEDMDDLYMWLNEIGYAFKDYKRYGDKLESDGIEALLANNNIQLPITDLRIAVKLYQMAKAAQ